MFIKNAAAMAHSAVFEIRILAGLSQRLNREVDVEQKARKSHRK